MDKKRLIFIIIFIVAVIALGYGMYRVFFAKPKARPGTPGAPITGEPTAPGAFPTAGVGERRPGEAPLPGALPTGVERPTDTFRPAPPAAREQQVVETAVVDPTVTAGGNVQFYNQNDGKFYRVASDGSAQELSDEVFFNVQKVEWSPNQSSAIIEYPDGANIYYDFETKRQATLPKHWEDFSFSAGGDQIAAKSIGLSPENRWLVAANPDGENVQFVEPLGNNASKVTVDWSPNRQVLALSRTGQPLGADRQEVFLIGLHGENFRSLTVEGRGLQSQWSTEGQQLLYSVYNARSEFKPELWITDASGDSIGANRRPLQLNTWAEKCAFGNERTLYCAVPNRLEVGAGFQPTLADSTPDTLYKIDLNTGLKTPVQLDSAHVISKVFVAPDGRSLHFTDKAKDGVFKVNL